MKKLMTFVFTSGEIYAKTRPDFVWFSEEEHQPNEPADWREDLRRYAAVQGWVLRESDLASVATMVAFLICHSPSFSNCVLRDDVQLPGGAVLLDSKAGGEQSPIMLLWEEDFVDSTKN